MEKVTEKNFSAIHHQVIHSAATLKPQILHTCGTCPAEHIKQTMAAPCTMISALVNNTKTAAIHVRVTRIWKSFNPNDKKLLHTNAILLDQEGNHIWAMIRNTQKNYILKTLEEDGVYIISKVIVVSAPGRYRSVNRDLSLNFYHKTKIERLDDTGVIPKYKFELQDFQAIGGLIGDVTTFIDVIGWVVSYGDFVTTQRGAKKMDINLLNNRQETMTISLWGEKGPEFLAELAKTKNVAVFAVITGLLAKTYFGGFSLSPGDGTKYYFNIDYAPLNDLKAAILDAVGATIDTLPAPKHKPLTSPARPEIAKATIDGILEMQLPPGKEFIRCACKAKIIDIVRDENWFYNCCPTCNRALYLADGHYRCRACTEPPSTIKQGYKVRVTVEDDSGTTTFTLFNKDAELLIGIPIEKVISEMAEAQQMDDIPSVVDNIIGKVCDFEIKITSYNIKNHLEDYTVSKVTECNRAPPANEEEAGASSSSAKKRKSDKTSQE